MQGSTYNAMQLLTKFFHVTGKIYPASETALTLHAVFQDGHEVAGESSIAQYDGMIERVYVTNTYNDEEPKASRKVVDAIMNSDMIVLGPGSLYTSILPNLVIPEIRQALIETKADVTYICNIMTQYGETEQFSDADHVAVLNRHLGSDVIDNVLVNIKKVPKEYMASNKFDEYLVQVEHDFEGLRREAKTVVSSNFLRLENGGAFHHGDLVVDELMHLVRNKSLSFTIKVKEEIIAASSKDKAELSALIKMSGSVGLTNQGLTLSISTENAKIARHIYQLMESRYQSNPELRHHNKTNLKKNRVSRFCR